MLPNFWLSAFDAIFTDKLWSLRGFVRSCMASIVVVTILFGAWYSSIPDDWHLIIYSTGDPYNPPATTWAVIAIRTPDLRDVMIGPHGELDLLVKKGPLNLQSARLGGILFAPFIYNLFVDFYPFL
jgi:hypothetical protein